jgi:hypothetical protein
MPKSSIDLLTDQQLKDGISFHARKIYAYERLIQGHAILRDLNAVFSTLYVEHCGMVEEYYGCMISSKRMFDYYRIIAVKRGILTKEGGENH